MTPEAMVAVGGGAIGILTGVYSVVISHQTKKAGDIKQLVKDLTGDEVFCEKVIGFVVPSDRFKERAREVFVDRVQVMMNEGHLVGGEFKDGLRREIDELKQSINGLRGDIQIMLRRSDKSS